MKKKSKSQRRGRRFQVEVAIFVTFVLAMVWVWLPAPGIKIGRKEIQCPVERTLPQIVAEVRSAVVKIRIEGVGGGSGVFIRPNLIMTAGHILNMSERSRYRSWPPDGNDSEPIEFIITCDNGVKLVTTKRYQEPNIDIGFLEVNLTDPNYFHDLNSIKSLRISRLEFSDVVVGELVFAIGSPYGSLFQSVTYGIVSALDRKKLTPLWKSPLLQTDCPMNPGNSGCPLFNLQGQIVGINVGNLYGGYGGHGLHVCIPSKVIWAALAKYDAIRELERVVGE